MKIAAQVTIPVGRLAIFCPYRGKRGYNRGASSGLELSDPTNESLHSPVAKHYGLPCGVVTVEVVNYRETPLVKKGGVCTD